MLFRQEAEKGFLNVNFGQFDSGKSKYMNRFYTHLAVLVISVTSIQGENILLEEMLIGIWQEAPVISSGWAEAYQFFEDGRFQLNHNQVECDKRELTVSGSWKLKGKTLILLIKEKSIITGGKLVPAAGSCGGDFEIEGGKTVKRKLKNPVKKVIRLGSLKFDQEFKHPVIEFNKRRFWKHRDDPEDY